MVTSIIHQLDIVHSARSNQRRVKSINVIGRHEHKSLLTSKYKHKNTTRRNTHYYLEATPSRTFKSPLKVTSLGRLLTLAIAAAVAAAGSDSIEEPTLLGKAASISSSRTILYNYDEQQQHYINTHKLTCGGTALSA